MHANDVLRMVKRYAPKADLGNEACCHTFLATGISTYLLLGVTIERPAPEAATLATHDVSPMFHRQVQKNCRSFF